MRSFPATLPPVVGVVTTDTELRERVLQGRAELLLRYCMGGTPL